MDALTVHRCLRCGHQTFLSHTRCPKCRNVEFSEVALTHDGEIVTYTILTATRPGFKKPLLLAIGDFGDGVRVLAQLDAPEPRVGLKVKASIGTLGELQGAPTRGIRFTSN